MSDISNDEDLIDVRDLIEFVKERSSEREDLKDALDTAIQEVRDNTVFSEELLINDERFISLCQDVVDAKEALDDFDKDDDQDEFTAVSELLDELKGNGDDEEWKGDWYPVTLIRDDYFQEYAEELVKDIGDMPATIPHYIVIDWEATAHNIQQDYKSVDYDGVTYWYR